MARPSAKAGWHLLAGVAWVALCVALIIHDLSGANRPHELKLVPLVSILSVGNALLCGRTLALFVAAWRARAEVPLYTRDYLLLPIGVAYACVSMFLVVASVGTWIG